MTGEDQREQELERAMRQLVADHHAGKLSMGAYRRLRRTLLEASESGEELLPLLSGEIPKTARPGWVVRGAVGGIVALLLLLLWLFR